MYPESQHYETRERSQRTRDVTVPCKYKAGRVIGRGTYATVKEMVHIESGRMYAGKIINHDRMRGNMRLVHNEISVLKKLSRKHPNILALVDHFATQNNTYLVTEMCAGGELFEYIHQRGSLDESEAAHVVKQIVRGVAFLHAHGVVHRDLKTENCFVRQDSPDGPLSIAIGDFGMAQLVAGNDGRIVTNVCGTPGYMAPEMIQRTGHGRPIDMWAVGVITYFALSGTNPFDRLEYRSNPHAKHYATVSAIYDFSPAHRWRGVSPVARDFIASLLVVDPCKRMTAKQALEHPWLRSCSTPEVSVSSSMLSAYSCSIDTHSKMFDSHSDSMAASNEAAANAMPQPDACAPTHTEESLERRMAEFQFRPQRPSPSSSQSTHVERYTEHPESGVLAQKELLNSIPECSRQPSADLPAGPGGLSRLINMQRNAAVSRYQLRPRQQQQPAYVSTNHLGHMADSWLPTPPTSASCVDPMYAQPQAHR
ncbi:Calcium/calmodulin-dependent protein kinase type I [Coemansia sp. RSA 2706]|nr:Calcium/calmodulin-dependent protein kinase type I [Coemansia sp. RSA 2706]KAJ2318935.1 Calcium/calmodulin-dependent protein kinase type I [Coemansia sp. RSA 2704]KAJ2327147.1 Calcium/calmodulin-dependent protein kinase type I [Coemansia sp. RSA 2702]KAJ2730843.1 Calcium/calmodulin-dependent protein kinase type I [Coemansia sp. Cherry 401B]